MYLLLFLEKCVRLSVIDLCVNDLTDISNLEAANLNLLGILFFSKTSGDFPLLMLLLNHK